MQNEPTGRTKGPWKMKQSAYHNIRQKEDCLVYVIDKDNNPLHIAETFQYQNDDNYKENGTSIANAAFIVQACNAHDDHVATIKAQAQKILEQRRNLGEYAELCRVEATWKDEKDDLVAALKNIKDLKVGIDIRSSFGDLLKAVKHYAEQALKSAGVK